MELTEAITTLEEVIARRQPELDAAKLALSVLKEQYEPELTTLENANREAASAKAEAATLGREKEEAEAQAAAAVADLEEEAGKRAKAEEERDAIQEALDAALEASSTQTEETVEPEPKAPQDGAEELEERAEEHAS